MANRCADRYTFVALDLSQPKIDVEFAIRLSANILKEFQEPTCRKPICITNGLLVTEVPPWAQRELEDIQAMRESSRAFCGMRKIS
jgi:hypothetical protein